MSSIHSMSTDKRRSVCVRDGWEVEAPEKNPLSVPIFQDFSLNTECNSENEKFLKTFFLRLNILVNEGKPDFCSQREVRTKLTGSHLPWFVLCQFLECYESSVFLAEHFFCDASGFKFYVRKTAKQIYFSFLVF